MTVRAALPRPAAAGLPGAGAVRVVCRPHPFAEERIDALVPEGLTLAQIVAALIEDPALRAHARVWLADRTLTSEPHAMPASHWHRVRPRAGAAVLIRVVPMGGGGGGKNPLRVVLSIAVIAASFFLGPQLGVALGLPTASTLGGLLAAPINLAAAVGGFIITTVGTLLINALVPPPRPQLSALSLGARSSPALALTGTSNRAAPYHPVICVYGRVRVFPVLAARTLTESEGDESYLRALFDFGYGPIELSDIRIGAVPLTQFDGVETQIRQGWDSDAKQTLYPAAVREDGYAMALTQAGGAQIVETRDETTEAILDVTFLGLVVFDAEANRTPRTVTVRFEWRAVGAGSWTLHQERAFNAASDQRLVFGHRIVFPAAGRYELRVTRLTADTTDPAIRDQTYLTAVRSVTGEYPIRAKGRCLLAMRIRASGQLAGQLDQVSAVAERFLPVWTGSAWVTQKTRNPAWAYVDVLRGRANRRRVPDSRLDLPAFLDWAAACAAAPPTGTGPRWEFNGVFDFQTTAFEALRDIASAGRAAFGMRDGKFSIVRDAPQEVPIQHFSPRNSAGFTGRRLFRREAHALRVRYIEPQREWSQQEVLVYADGQDESSASEFEELELFGCTSRDQAWREGRYHMAVARLRPERYELTTDIEHLLCTRGDLVRVSHDVPMWGLGSGRIAGLTTDGGGNVTTITLDEAVPMAAGGSYAVRIRRADASSVTAGVVAVAGEHTTLTLDPAIPAASAPEIGDLALFGEAGRETVELIVREIRPGPDLSARLVLVDAAPAVHAAETAPIPPWDPQATEPPVITRPVPRPAQIIEVFSDSRALIRTPEGLIVSRVGVDARAAPGEPIVGVGLQLRWRPAGSGQRWRLSAAEEGPRATLFTGSVADRASVEVAVRAVGPGGETGEWTAAVTHEVIGKTAPPADVTGFAATIERRGIVFSWEPNTEADFLDFELREGGASWEGGTRRYRGKDTTAILPPRPAGSYVFRIVARDTGGRISQAPAELAVDIAGPAIGLGQGTIEQGMVRLSWEQADTAFEVARYEVVRGADPAAPADAWLTGAAVLTVPVTWQGHAVFWVRAIDVAGTAGPWGRIDVAVQAPGPPVGLRAQVIDNTVLFYWQPPTDGALPVRAYELRRGAAWSDAVVIGEKYGTFTTVEERVGGAFVYWLAAIDVAGNVGPPAEVAAQVRQPPDYQLQDEHVVQWAGTITNGVVVDGRLLLPVDTAETWQAHFDARGWAAPQQQLDAGYPLYIEPSPASGSYAEVIDYGAVLPQLTATIEVAAQTVAAGATLAWTVEASADGSNWTLIGTTTPSVSAVDARYLRLTVTVTRGTTRGLVWLTPPVVRLEVKVRRIEGVDVVSNAAAGRTITFAALNESFVDVRAITVTPRGTAALIPVVDFADTPNPAGFTVYLFNTAGTKVTGGFAWAVSGV